MGLRGSLWGLVAGKPRYDVIFFEGHNRHRHPVNRRSPSSCQSINNQSIRVSHKRTKHSNPYVQSTHPPRHRPRVSKWHTQGGHEVRTLLSEQQHHQQHLVPSSPVTTASPHATTPTPPAPRCKPHAASRTLHSPTALRNTQHAQAHPTIDHKHPNNHMSSTPHP